MKMYLTDGMFGRKLEQIGQDFETFEDGMKYLADWKDSDISKGLYKIEPYDRIIYDKENDETAIDFGDYSYFMLIDRHTGETENVS